MRPLLWTIASVYLLVAPIAAQDYLDAAKVDSKYFKVEFENDQVRVVRFVIPPGATTAQHDHPNSVIVVLTNCDGRVTAPDGKTAETHGKAGSATWRNALRHTFENVGNQPAEGLVVEPKGPGNAAWTPPPRDSVKTAPETHKLEFENDQVRVVRVHYEPGEKAPMHDHPDQVQIWLTDADIPIKMPDGKTQVDHVKSWACTLEENLFPHGREHRR
jgi:beta-alanine degradation protein BauB